MNIFADWLIMHNLDDRLVNNILMAISSKQLSFYPDSFLDNYTQENLPFDLRYQNDCFKSIIIPAFVDAFGHEKTTKDMLSFIKFEKPQYKTNHIPYTEDCGAKSSPVVVMNWNKTFSDLICLAHETAHALQLQFSKHIFTPPLARETCAFLGELILINWTRKNSIKLFEKLTAVWLNENDQYLASDVHALLKANNKLDSYYHYRQNYPIARIAAIFLFDSLNSDELLNLFSANQKIMSLLPLQELATIAGNIENHSMPYPFPDTRHPTINNYRRLGAMVLLDINHSGREAKRNIKDYYHNLRFHIENNTVCLALGQSRKPIGYATWTKNSNETKTVIDHKVAPFGDHLKVQQHIVEQLNSNGQVTSLHPNSLRKDQIAW
ncbi:MAG: hypothetical protein HRU28_14185 [Rhizobiales bacterium]|nr:hypothetical protein [Hyphomicrobiales bacterium]